MCYSEESQGLGVFPDYELVKYWINNSYWAGEMSSCSSEVSWILKWSCCDHDTCINCVNFIKVLLSVSLLILFKNIIFKKIQLGKIKLNAR
jgi:hypothetical protein